MSKMFNQFGDFYNSCFDQNIPKNVYKHKAKELIEF